MAGNLTVCSGRCKPGDFPATAIHHQRTARVETAALGLPLGCTSALAQSPGAWCSGVAATL